jgi:hypothetical protein
MDVKEVKVLFFFVSTHTDCIFPYVSSVGVEFEEFLNNVVL